MKDLPKEMPSLLNGLESIDLSYWSWLKGAIVKADKGDLEGFVECLSKMPEELDLVSYMSHPLKFGDEAAETQSLLISVLQNKEAAPELVGLMIDKGAKLKEIHKIEIDAIAKIVVEPEVLLRLLCGKKESGVVNCDYSAVNMMLTCLIKEGLFDSADFLMQRFSKGGNLEGYLFRLLSKEERFLQSSKMFWLSTLKGVMYVGYTIPPSLLKLAYEKSNWELLGLLLEFGVDHRALLQEIEPLLFSRDVSADHDLAYKKAALCHEYIKALMITPDHDLESLSKRDNIRTFYEDCYLLSPKRFSDYSRRFDAYLIGIIRKRRTVYERGLSRASCAHAPLVGGGVVTTTPQVRSSEEKHSDSPESKLLAARVEPVYHSMPGHHAPSGERRKRAFDDAYARETQEHESAEKKGRGDDSERVAGTVSFTSRVLATSVKFVARG